MKTKQRKVSRQAAARAIGQIITAAEILIDYEKQQTSKVQSKRRRKGVLNAKS